MRNDPNIRIMWFNKDFNNSDIVRIFYDAFEKKITAFIKSKRKAISIYEKSLNTDRIMVAVLNKKILGIAGLHYDKRNFMDTKYYILRLHYNPVKSFFMYWMLRFMTPKVQKGTLRVDILAVESSYRNMGIGTKLIECIIGFASQNGYGEVLLEVVDTNPKAKALYERMGFKVKKKINYHFFTRRAGFSSEYIMVYKIPEKS